MAVAAPSTFRAPGSVKKTVGGDLQRGGETRVDDATPCIAAVGAAGTEAPKAEAQPEKDGGSGHDETPDSEEEEEADPDFNIIDGIAWYEPQVLRMRVRAVRHIDRGWRVAKTKFSRAR